MFSSSKTKAFSLIELMVVIAIIAILASVAVPAYRNYRLSAKFSSLKTILVPMIQKSINYANTHGKFGDPYETGVIPAPLPQYGIDPSEAAELLPGFQVGWYYGLTWFDSDLVGCARRARMQLRFDENNVTSSFGLEPNSVIVVIVDWWTDKSKVVHISDFFYDMRKPDNTQVIDQIIRGWTNVGPGYVNYNPFGSFTEADSECM